MKLKSFNNDNILLKDAKQPSIYTDTIFMLKLMSIYNVRVIQILYLIFESPRTLSDISTLLKLNKDMVWKILTGYPELFKYTKQRWCCNIDALMKEHTAFRK